MVTEIPVIDHQAVVGKNFLAALMARDFESLQVCFHAEVRFRALVPSGIREGVNAGEATAWLRKWLA